MPEGSVDVDQGSSFSETTDSQEESHVNNTEEETSTTDSQKAEGTEDQAEYTDKGTKLDSNPESRVHQELANERRKIAQYETVLGNPAMLRAYAEEAGISLSEAKQEIKDEVKETKFSAENLKTGDDVANALNELKGSFSKEMKTLQEENSRLKTELGGMSSNQRNQQVATNLTQDVSQIQKTYPELNPNSPDYDQDLEREIGSIYHDLDFDNKTQSYKGQVSLAKITDRVMKAAGLAKKKGSQEAQTDVRVKQAGRVVTSSKGATTQVEESKDASTSIAQKIAKIYGKR